MLDTVLPEYDPKKIRGINFLIRGGTSKVERMFNFKKWNAHSKEIIKIKIFDYKEPLIVSLGEDKLIKVWSYKCEEK